MKRTKRYFFRFIISCCYHFNKKTKNDNIFSFFFHFSAVFSTPIIFTLRAIIMSCLRAQSLAFSSFPGSASAVAPALELRSESKILKALNQNKPATTCSRADHVGFQTDSVTSNSNSESAILNCCKQISRQSRKVHEKSQIH